MPYSIEYSTVYCSEQYSFPLTTCPQWKQGNLSCNLGSTTIMCWIKLKVCHFFILHQNIVFVLFNAVTLFSFCITLSIIVLLNNLWYSGPLWLEVECKETFWRSQKIYIQKKKDRKKIIYIMSFECFSPQWTPDKRGRWKWNLPEFTKTISGTYWDCCNGNQPDNICSTYFIGVKMSNFYKLT